MINKENFKQKVWPLPVRDLLCVGKYTEYKQTIAIQVRDKNLSSITRQKKLLSATYLGQEIRLMMMELFQAHYHWQAPIRSIAIQPQLPLFCDKDKERQEKLEETVRDIRRRFGNKIIVHANLLQDQELTNFNPQTEHIIHPVNFFR